MDIKALFKKLDFTVDIRPQRYSDSSYIVYDKEYGLYTKKEAEAICAFLMRDAVRKFIWKASQ
jgi:hypothetical protein